MTKLEPGGYWHPKVSLTDVYYLRRDGSWWLSPDGIQVPAEQLPRDLQFLGGYAD